MLHTRNPLASFWLDLYVWIVFGFFLESNYSAHVYSWASNPFCGSRSICRTLLGYWDTPQLVQSENCGDGPNMLLE